MSKQTNKQTNKLWFLLLLPNICYADLSSAIVSRIESASTDTLEGR